VLKKPGKHEEKGGEQRKEPKCSSTARAWQEYINKLSPRGPRGRKPVSSQAERVRFFAPTYRSEE